MVYRLFTTKREKAETMEGVALNTRVTYFCLTKQMPGKYCSIKDDAQAIFEKAETADVVVLASPVYFMRTSARMAALIDRFRVFVFGNLTAGRMKNKIGVSMAAAWLRHCGVENNAPDSYPDVSGSGDDSDQRASMIWDQCDDIVPGQSFLDNKCKENDQPSFLYSLFLSLSWIFNSSNGKR